MAVYELTDVHSCTLTFTIFIRRYPCLGVSVFPAELSRRPFIVLFLTHRSSAVNLMKKLWVRNMPENSVRPYLSCVKNRAVSVKEIISSRRETPKGNNLVRSTSNICIPGRNPYFRIQSVHLYIFINCVLETLLDPTTSSFSWKWLGATSNSPMCSSRDQSINIQLL